MEFILITNNSEIASYAEECGVERIMVDLEIIGKKERQSNRDTLISNHTIEDVDRLRNTLKKSKLQVRVNPIYQESEKEINEVISRGAEIVMLPMFKYRWEVEKFVSIVNGKAKVSLLLETPQALVRVDEILQVEGIDEVYIGLNDLHLLMGLDFMFELLSGGIVEYLANKIKKKGIPFGFGGIARLGTGIINASLILSEHVRLGSSMVILSRSFHGRAKTLNELKSQIDLKSEMEKLRSYYSYLSKLSEEELFINKEKINQAVVEYLTKKYKSP